MIDPLRTLLTHRWNLLKQNRDEGQSVTELAIMAAVLIVVAAGLVVAIKSKVAEKIGIIEGG
ncbi:hypothetical protein [Streptomyces sp. SGAir0957]